MFQYVDESGKVLETDHHCARCGFKQATVKGVRGYENFFLCEKCALKIWSEETRSKNVKRANKRKLITFVLLFLFFLSSLTVLFVSCVIR